MTMTRSTSSRTALYFAALRLALLFAVGLAVRAQEAPQPQPGNPSAVSLTLKHAIELALQNSKDIQIAKLQASLANRSAMITKSQFMPNLYAGSGAGYTFGIPETPGGRAPALFSVTYTEQVFNEPLRGQGKELQEQANSQKILLEDARNTVIVRTASIYLELGMVRHSLELLRKEQESADKILSVTQQREKENYELPVAVTKDQLTKARVVQRSPSAAGNACKTRFSLAAGNFGKIEIKRDSSSEISFTSVRPIWVVPNCGTRSSKSSRPRINSKASSGCNF